MMTSPVPARTDRHLLQGCQQERLPWTRETPTAIITFSGGATDDFSGSESEQEVEGAPGVQRQTAAPRTTAAVVPGHGLGVSGQKAGVVCNAKGTTVGGSRTGQARLGLNRSEYVYCDKSDDNSSPPAPRTAGGVTPPPAGTTPQSARGVTPPPTCTSRRPARGMTPPPTCTTRRPAGGVTPPPTCTTRRSAGGMTPPPACTTRRPSEVMTPPQACTTRRLVEGVTPSPSCTTPGLRFNPFDRDMHMEEAHYENSPPEALDNAGINQLRDSREDTDDSLSESHSFFSESDDLTISKDLVTNTELGLAEDHFSRPEGTFGMSTAVELEMAIQNCKGLIQESPEPSDHRKNLVHKLIQLRIKLIEAKEGPVEEEEDVKCVVGHRFKQRESTGSKHYCEKCASVIWGVLQAWYKCTACGFCCHDKCLNLIYRTCANLKVKENPNYILSLCPEKGLDSQNYRCAECSTALSFSGGLEQARRCDYTGAYYCRRCHWNDVMVLPARVIHNWDMEPRKVCRASKQFLRLMATRACLRIQDINPMLFSLVEELNDVKKLREEILIMKKYFLSCQDALSSKLLLQLTIRQHFVENSDIYSLQDLVDVATDLLLPQLAKIHSSFAQHIKTDCQLCQAKGYMCELCDMQEVLFPFDNIAIVCDRCSTVLHRHCFLHRNQMCPKCARISRRAALVIGPSEPRT